MAVAMVKYAAITFYKLQAVCTSEPIIIARPVLMNADNTQVTIIQSMNVI